LKQSEIYIQNTSLFISIHEIYESKKNRLPIHMKRKSLQPSKRRRKGINPKFRI
jgi:hypothetical protein